MYSFSVHINLCINTTYVHGSHVAYVHGCLDAYVHDDISCFLSCWLPCTHTVITMHMYTTKATLLVILATYVHGRDDAYVHANPDAYVQTVYGGTLR